MKYLILIHQSNGSKMYYQYVDEGEVIYATVRREQGQKFPSIQAAGKEISLLPGSIEYVSKMEIVAE